jgi:hypothetical protein
MTGAPYLHAKDGEGWANVVRPVPLRSWSLPRPRKTPGELLAAANGVPPARRGRPATRTRPATPLCPAGNRLHGGVLRRSWYVRPLPALAGIFRACCAQFLLDCRNNLARRTCAFFGPGSGSGGRSRLAGMTVKRGTAEAGHGCVFGVVFLVNWRTRPRLAAGAGRRAHDQRGSEAGRVQRRGCRGAARGSRRGECRGRGCGGCGLRARGHCRPGGPGVDELPRPEGAPACPDSPGRRPRWRLGVPSSSLCHDLGRVIVVNARRLRGGGRLAFAGGLLPGCAGRLAGDGGRP